MRLKLDENLGHRWRDRLRGAGHDVDTVIEEDLSGATDTEVLAAAVEAQRSLVTLDVDFANPTRFDPAATSGIVVLRVRDSPGSADLDVAVDHLIDGLFDMVPRLSAGSPSPPISVATGHHAATARTQAAAGGAVVPSGGVAATEAAGLNDRLMRIPYALDARRAHPFVGRGELLADLVTRVDSGSAATVFVEGEPGGGKTALVAEALAQADGAAGRRVLFGSCDLGYGRSYEPVLRALRSDPDLFDRLLALPIKGLGLVVPELATAADVEENASLADRDQIAVQALVQALRVLTTDERLIVVIDDLQWAPPASVAVVRHLSRDRVGDRVTLLATMRSADIARNRPLADLLADLRVSSDVLRVRVAPLQPDDVVALTHLELDGEGLAPGDVDDLAGEVFVRSGGNALFAVELLRCRRDGETTLLPDSIALSVEHRLREFDPLLVDALEATAVAGPVAEPAVIAAACETDEASAADRLDDLVGLGWLHQDDGHYRCAHDVTREALLDRAPATRRLRLHARVGEHLRGQGEGALAVAAWHLRRAVPVVAADAAVSAAVEFAWSSVARQAPQDAEATLADVLDLLDVVSAPCRFDALLAMARVKQRLSDLQPAFDFAIDAAAAAEAIGDRARLARAATLACGGELACPDPRVSPMVQRVLSQIDDPIDLARLQAAHAFYAVWVEDRGAAARSLAEDAVTSARRQGDAQALTLSLYSLGLSLQGTPHVRERLAIGEELVTLAGDDAEVAFQGIRLAGPGAFELGDRAGFERHRAALGPLADRTGSALHRGYADMFDAGHSFLEGDLEAAEARAAHALVDALGGNFLDMFAGAIFLYRRQQGRLAELGLLGPGPSQSLQVAVWVAARALAASDLGELAVARAALDELLAKPLPTNLNRALIVAGIAEVAWRLEDHDAAQLARADLAARSGTLVVLPGAPGALGAADRFLALTFITSGDRQTAAELFDDAEQLERSVGASLLAAQTVRLRDEALAAHDQASAGW